MWTRRELLIRGAGSHVQPEHVGLLLDFANTLIVTNGATLQVGDLNWSGTFALRLGSGSLITATGNDYSFEEIFARQVRAFGQPGDTLVALSTSGRSKNIRRALDQAKACQLKSIALLGRDGGECAGIADVDLIVPGKATARIQEAHKFLLHVICEICETRLPR